MKFKNFGIFNALKKRKEAVNYPEKNECDSELECAQNCPYVGICDEGRKCPWDMNYD